MLRYSHDNRLTRLFKETIELTASPVETLWILTVLVWLNRKFFTWLGLSRIQPISSVPTWFPLTPTMAISLNPRSIIQNANSAPHVLRYLRALHSFIIISMHYKARQCIKQNKIERRRYLVLVLNDGFP